MARPPLPDDETLLGECEVQTFRSGGKGGQHQNTTDSGVRLIHRPTGLVVTARERRSQLQNRKLALARLKERLEEKRRVRRPRIPTKVPRKQRKKRLESKRRHAQKKKLRKPPKKDW
ncbi:MAG: peptide chain release factor-like protein [Rhodothermales bacterium]|nr:peptide chain release factor-like protein [Rhodothermales bacterium]